MTKNIKTLLKNNIKKNYIYFILDNLSLTRGLWMIFLIFKGMSLVQAGLLEGIFHITSLTMEMPTGSVADLLGRKVSRVAGRSLAVISSLLMVIANDFWLFALSFVFSALSYNLESGAGDALIYDSLLYIGEEKKYMRIAGKQEAILQLTSVASFIVGGILGKANYYWAFWGAVFLGTITLVFSFSFVEPPILKKYSKKKKGLGKKITTQITDSLKSLKNNKRASFLIIFSEILLAFSTCIFFYIQNFWKAEGKDEFQIGLILAAASGFSAIFGLTASKIEKFFGERKMLGLLCFTWFISIWGITLTDFKILFFIIIMIVEGLTFVVSSDYINKIIPSEYRATIISFGSMIFSLFMIFVFPIFGKIAESYSFFSSFLSLGILFSVLLPVQIFLLRKNIK